MVCPIHHFQPVAHCPMCNQFVSGFVHGVYTYPFTLWKGFNADPSVQKDMGRELRVMWKFYKKYPPTKERVQAAKEQYDELPPSAKRGIQDVVSYGSGHISGTLATGQLTLLATGRMLAYVITRRLGPGAIPVAQCTNALTNIFGGIVLNWYQLLGTSANILQYQREYLSRIPNGPQIYKEATDKFLEEEKKPDDGKS